MAEPDWFPSDLPELSSEQGPGLLADEQFWVWAFWLGNATQMEDEMKLRDIFGLEIYETSSAVLPDTETCKKLKHGSMEKEITGDTEDKSNSSVFVDDETEAEQMHLYHETTDHTGVPSLLDQPIQYGWRGRRRNCRKRRKSCWANAEFNSKLQYVWEGHHGPRKCRKRSTSHWEEISQLFGLPKPSACRGTTFGGRKKINRWTSHEAEMLVEGVSVFGIRSFDKVKRAYFKTSSRTKVNLKDKWRDLLRACGINVLSKKKVRPQAATLKIMEGLKERIISIHKHHPT